MRSYGFVGGQSVYAYANALTEGGVKGTIDSFWTLIDDLQRQLIVTKGKDLSQLEKIIILDEGLFEDSEIDRTDIKRRTLDIEKLQNAIAANANGVAVVIYTKHKEFYSYLNEYLRINASSRYPGLFLEYTSKGQIYLDDLVELFDRSFDVKIVGGIAGQSNNVSRGMTEEEMEREIEERVYIAGLLAERDTLLSVQALLDRRLEDVLYDLEEVLPPEEIDGQYSNGIRGRRGGRNQASRKSKGARASNRRGKVSDEPSSNGRNKRVRDTSRLSELDDFID